jgi:iron complex transport system ATP-binding protein
MTYVAAGVSLSIRAARIVDDVSIELRPGEIVAVAGPNGAGKSTLLSILAGDRRPTAGSVTLATRPVEAWPRGALARRRAVMRLGGDVAFPFTAEEVALLGRLPWHGGNPNDADHAVVRSLLTALDVAHLAPHPYASLSTGERQRVQLARAIAQVAEVGPGATDGPGIVGRYLLLDEPTSSLDPAHQHLAMRLLREQARGGCGVVAVLHDLDLAAAYADRLVLMAGGHVVAAGAIEEVLRADLLEAVFGIPMLVIPHPSRPTPVVLANVSPDGA